MHILYSFYYTTSSVFICALGYFYDCNVVAFGIHHNFCDHAHGVHGIIERKDKEVFSSDIKALRFSLATNEFDLTPPRAREGRTTRYARTRKRYMHDVFGAELCDVEETFFHTMHLTNRPTIEMPKRVPCAERLHSYFLNRRTRIIN